MKFSNTWSNFSVSMMSLAWPRPAEVANGRAISNSLTHSSTMYWRRARMWGLTKMWKIYVWSLKSSTLSRTTNCSFSLKICLSSPRLPSWLNYRLWRLYARKATIWTVCTSWSKANLLLHIRLQRMTSRPCTSAKRTPITTQTIFSKTLAPSIWWSKWASRLKMRPIRVVKTKTDSLKSSQPELLVRKQSGRGGRRRLWLRSKML